MIGGRCAYCFTVFSGDTGDRVGSSMDRGHDTGDVIRSGGQICRVTGLAGMGAGWRPMLVAVGEPANPQDQIPELGGHRSEASAPMDAGAGNVPMVSDCSPCRPGLTGCFGRAVHLRVDRRTEGELPDSFGKPAQDDFAGVADDR